METVNVNGESNDNGGRQMIEKRMSLPHTVTTISLLTQKSALLTKQKSSTLESLSTMMASKWTTPRQKLLWNGLRP